VGTGFPGKGTTRPGSNRKRHESHRQRTLTRELEWIRSTPKAKHQQNKARISRYNELLSEDYQKRNETEDLYLPAGPRLGDVVVRASGLAKAFGDNLLFEGLDFDLPPGGIVGIIGANGAGKTTLFKMITGMESADAGTIEIGDTVRIAYVDQGRVMNETRTLFDLIGDGLELMKVGEREMNVRQYLARFNFAGNDHLRPVKDLSGGEKNRVFLALALKQAGNLLLLDEPTNDLDVNTIRALENALANFAGCAVVISHDRYFLDRVCTHILAFEGDSKVRWFDGNFSEYEEKRIEELGDKALRPHRIVYRRLMRG
jgi:ATPase subunit of ABC transporter with duplicated ATPase domains